MQALKLTVLQNQSSYKNEGSSDNIVYPLPTFSAVIDALHNICGYTEYKDMKISISGRFDNIDKSLYDIELVLHIVASEKVLDDISNNISEIKSIGNGEGAVCVRVCERRDLYDNFNDMINIGKTDSIISDLAGYVRSDNIKNEKILINVRDKKITCVDYDMSKSFKGAERENQHICYVDKLVVDCYDDEVLGGESNIITIWI